MNGLLFGAAVGAGFAGIKQSMDEIESGKQTAPAA
jgi:hypothetical protein